MVDQVGSFDAPVRAILKRHHASGVTKFLPVHMK